MELCNFFRGGYILGGRLKRTWTQPFTNISVLAWMEEGPHDDILVVLDRTSFLWLQNHETDSSIPLTLASVLSPSLKFPAELQRLNPCLFLVLHTTSWLPSVKLQIIGPHKKAARLLCCHLDCPRTSLNLFATKFDQVLNILAKRQEDLDYILIDSCYLLMVLFEWLMFLLVGAVGR